MLQNNLRQKRLGQTLMGQEHGNAMEQAFLDTISCTLKKCVRLTQYEQYGHDNWLLFPTYDNEFIPIGCIENENYLLDSDFIYKRLTFMQKGNDVHLPSKNTCYNDLFSIGVLKSDNRFQRKPLCKLRFKKHATTSCFCIPCHLVDVDVSEIPDC